MQYCSADVFFTSRRAKGTFCLQNTKNHVTKYNCGSTVKGKVSLITKGKVMSSLANQKNDFLKAVRFVQWDHKLWAKPVCCCSLEQEMDVFYRRQLVELSIPDLTVSATITLRKNPCFYF